MNLKRTFERWVPSGLMQLGLRCLAAACLALASVRLRVHRVLQQEIAKARREGSDVRRAYSQLERKHLARSTDRRCRPFFSRRRWTFRTPAESFLTEAGFNG